MSASSDGSPIGGKKTFLRPPARAKKLAKTKGAGRRGKKKENTWGQQIHLPLLPPPSNCWRTQQSRPQEAHCRQSVSSSGPEETSILNWYIYNCHRHYMYIGAYPSAPLACFVSVRFLFEFHSAEWAVNKNQFPYFRLFDPICDDVIVDFFANQRTTQTFCGRKTRKKTTHRTYLDWCPKNKKHKWTRLRWVNSLLPSFPCTACWGPFSAPATNIHIDIAADRQ